MVCPCYYSGVKPSTDISYVVFWSVCLSFSLIHFRNGPKYLTRETAQVFILLMGFLQLDLVSRCFFLVLCGSLFSFFLFDGVCFNIPKRYVIKMCQYWFMKVRHGFLGNKTVELDHTTGVTWLEIVNISINQSIRGLKCSIRECSIASQYFKFWVSIPYSVFGICMRVKISLCVGQN